jgi:DNA-binding NarL/FixJ family response regulator
VRGRVDPRATRISDVDLVIVDLIDLLNRGAETVRQVRDRFPGAAVIGTSTQLNGPLASDSALARTLGVSRLVPKPCAKRELLEAVIAAVGVAG